MLIDPGHRGSGLGVALMREIVRVGFDQVGLHRLQLAVYDFNAAAIACYERVGFVVEGRLRDATLGSGGYWNAYVMALLDRVQGGRGAVGRRPHRCAPREVHDAATVARLVDPELGYSQDRRAAGAQLAEWAGDSAAGRVLAAELDGIRPGSSPRTPSRTSSGAVYSSASWRSRSTRAGSPRRRGRRLLGAVEAWAAGLGCRDIEIDEPPDAR